MSNFSNSRFQRHSSGKKSFGDNRGFDRRPKQMYTAECAKCGNTCEVPFRPNGTRPVYCNDCFVRDDSQGRSDFSSSRAPRREFAPRPDHTFNDIKDELKSLNEKMERLIVLLTPAPKIKKSLKKKK